MANHKTLIWTLGGHHYAIGLLPHRDKCLDIYIKAVQRDILDQCKNRSPHYKNLSQTEQDALKGLIERSDITIKPADKGCAIVIRKKEDYITEAERQLSDTCFYKPTDTDQTSQFKNKVSQAVMALLKNKNLP